jgi:hypothetical protein
MNRDQDIREAIKASLTKPTNAEPGFTWVRCPCGWEWRLEVDEIEETHTCFACRQTFDTEVMR